MTPTPLLTLRQPELTRAVAALDGDALRLLLHLAGGACPRTNRVWTTPLRASEALGLSVPMIEAHLAALVASGELSLWTRGVGALRCYELGSLVVRAGEAPENLPVAPDP